MGIDWLRGRVPGFGALRGAELQAISDFSLLWSLFEARLFDGYGSARSICEAAKEWMEAGSLDDDPYGAQFRYFRDRYYAKDAFTHHFYELRLRRNDNEALVRAAFDGTDDALSVRTAAVFIVIYRYRNNLFHGAKWDYGLAGQFGNFSHANAALMTALDRHGDL